MCKWHRRKMLLRNNKNVSKTQNDGEEQHTNVATAEFWQKRLICPITKCYAVCLLCGASFDDDDSQKHPSNFASKYNTVITHDCSRNRGLLSCVLITVLFNYTHARKHFRRKTVFQCSLSLIYLLCCCYKTSLFSFLIYVSSAKTHSTLSLCGVDWINVH